MFNNILIEYLFLINLIKSEIILNNKLFYNLEGISNELLVTELSYCENQIKDFIQFYTNFDLDYNYNKKFNLYNQIENLKLNKKFKVYDFSFNNEIFFIKNISLLNEKSYTLKELLEKKNNYLFNNNIILRNINKKYYLNFFKYNYFNFTNIINFVFNIDLLTILENQSNINISKNLNLTNLNSYKNISKNITNKFNPIRINNQNIYLKFYKNLNYFDALNLDQSNLNLAKNHFTIIKNLYTTEYNFKILLNFFKSDNYKEFYLKLPINYITSNICDNLVKSCYKNSPSIDYYLNNLLYDKVIYNQNEKNINESLIFIKKRITNTPLIFNYKFKNKFNYFSNKKYNLPIHELKNYNLDFFNVSKTKRMTEINIDLNYFYYVHANIKSEISRASSLIKYNLPRIRPFIMRNNPERQYLYDSVLSRLSDVSSDVTNINHSFNYNHYLYGFFKGGTSSLVNFTQIDMFHNNCDMFFFKGDTYNKQHHHVSILNKTSLVRRASGFRSTDFFWESEKVPSDYYKTNLIYEKTKYERALNLMFNFNEELKSNNTLIEYICNSLFGFIKDNNETYIAFKDHYNKNNFIGKHILYRINNLSYNKNIKYNIFYREYLDILHVNSWKKPFSYNRGIISQELPLYLHTKKFKVYPIYTVWPITDGYISKHYRRKGYFLNHRQGLNFFKFVSDDLIIPYSRFLKTGKISESIYNNYYNFLPFLYYINKFDFIKKSIDDTKRQDFISFIPKFKIYSFNIFDSIQNFKYFEKLNSILIKFNNNLYNNNNQKLDQSFYNLNNISNKILNYIPNTYYEKYPTLEWNNKLFFNILNRKLFYKHLISFGDLSNKFVQNSIYDYAKIIFFEEKLKFIFFNRNIFKNKNFENLNDFIRFKINNSKLKTKNFYLYQNENSNFLEDYQNIKKILIAPYLHIKKHYKIFYFSEERHQILKSYKHYFNANKKFLKELKNDYNNNEKSITDGYNMLYTLINKDHVKVAHHPFKNFDEFYHFFMDFIEQHYNKFFENLRDYSYELKYRHNSPKQKEFPYIYFLKYFHESSNINYYWFCYKKNVDFPDGSTLFDDKFIPCDFEHRSQPSILNDFYLLSELITYPIFKKYLFFHLHFFSNVDKPKGENYRFFSRYSFNHMNNYSFFFYQIPSNYLNHIIKNNKLFNSTVIFDKFFSLILISNLKILSYFQKIDKVYNLDKNFNLFKIFRSEININDINLIKKNSITNYKLYKNRLIEEAGLYNVDIMKKNNKQQEDENYFLLFNRKRLDNESIYKSWHSTKFLNKKIEYHLNDNFFNLEKKINNLNKLSIFNILKIKSLSDLYKINYLGTSFNNFFSTDLNYNRIVLHKKGTNFFIRNLNFAYPQDNLKNIKVFSFFTYIKDKIGFSGSSKKLNGTFKNYYLQKQIDFDNEYNEYDDKYRKAGVYKYGYRKQIKFRNAYERYLRKYEDFLEYSTFFKIDSFKSNIKSLPHLTKKKNFHNMYKYLSYFQYYGDTRYPKNKKNFKKLNFIFNIYNFQSYFINDRYAFENKNLISLQQFYNHRTTSDYLRNLINYKKKQISKDYYLSLDNNNKNDIEFISPYYNLYNLYTPIKIWEIKLSNKLFPYFYSKNLSFNYKIVQQSRLNKMYDNIYMKRSNFKFRKKNNFKILEYFRYFMFELTSNKFLNFEEEKNYSSFFSKNFFQNTKKENQLKKKFYINSIGHLMNNEYLYHNYKIKKNFLLKNEKYTNFFNFKINDFNIYSYIYNIEYKLPNHLNYKLLFDLYNYDETIFISKSIKAFNYSIKNNFYVKIPYISEFYTKSIYDFFNEKKIRFFKLRTLRKRKIDIFTLTNIYETCLIKPYFTIKPRADYLKDYFNKNICFKVYKYNELNFNLKIAENKFVFNFDKLNTNNLILFFKTIKDKNFNNQLYLSFYKGNSKYLNNNFRIINKNNNYLFFSKIFEFNKYILLKKSIISYYPFFNPYDYYIFRYKASFSSLNNVLYRTNSNLNLRIFINNLFKVGEYKSKNFDLFYDLLDRNLWSLLDKDLSFTYLRKDDVTHYNYIFKFNHIFKKNSFTLKYYENISMFNKKKIEELSFFGFLLKNNIIMGIFEFNNLYNLSYNFKYEYFYINNNEANVYSINKLLNTIFILKNKYIWLIFFYYNNFFYFLINAKKILEDFLLEPVNFWSYYFYFKIPIIFSVDYKLLLIDILLTLYIILIQILITFYNWFCISGEGLINLKDYIIFNHNNLDWFLLNEKYNLYPCDLYGRSLFEMKISRTIYILFYISYFIIYIKLSFLLFHLLNKFYNLFLLNLRRKKKYFFINNKFDLEINNKIHFYYLNYNKFVNNFIYSNNKFEIIFFFKGKHSYKYYKSKFKCKLKLPYFLDEASLRRINKMKILTNFETHYFILDPDLKKLRTTLSFLNSSYALFTKTRTIEIGNLIIKGNIKRILYIHQLSNLITYDPILGITLMPNSMNIFEKKDIYFIDKIFLNNQLKIFNLMPLSEEENYMYIPKFIFKNLIKYKLKYTNVYYTYNFLFFFTFDSLLTIEGTLFRISSPNFFKPLIFLNQNISPRSFSFFI